MVVELDKYQQQLLEGWEEVFKKGQLTLWILLALKDSPKHMTEIKEFIKNVTNGVVSADAQSMYRALRRYHDVELVGFHQEPGNSGPDLKIYRLTKTGKTVLSAFVKRNITSVFMKPNIKQLIEKE